MHYSYLHSLLEVASIAMQPVVLVVFMELEQYFAVVAFNDDKLVIGFE